VKINNNIKFIAVDFEKDNLFNLLIQGGFNTTKTTLFLLEGVTFYLPENIFVQLLKMIKENSPPGSRVCFDFQTIINNDKLIKTDLKDETIKFGIKKDKIEIFVSENGYRIIEYLNSNDLEKRFLILENGEQFGEIAPIMNLLLIEHVH
jgi:methyltransferase (TIGR00027 family)